MVGGCCAVYVWVKGKNERFGTGVNIRHPYCVWLLKGCFGVVDTLRTKVLPFYVITFNFFCLCVCMCVCGSVCLNVCVYTSRTHIAVYVLSTIRHRIFPLYIYDACQLLLIWVMLWWCRRMEERLQEFVLGVFLGWGGGEYNVTAPLQWAIASQIVGFINDLTLSSCGRRATTMSSSDRDSDHVYSYFQPQKKIKKY